MSQGAWLSEGVAQLGVALQGVWPRGAWLCMGRGSARVWYPFRGVAPRGAWLRGGVAPQGSTVGPRSGDQGLSPPPPICPSSALLPVQPPGTWREACPASGPWVPGLGNHSPPSRTGEAALGQGRGLEVPFLGTWDWMCTSGLWLDASDPKVSPAPPPHHYLPPVLAPPLVSRDSGLVAKGPRGWEAEPRLWRLTFSS